MKNKKNVKNLENKLKGDLKSSFKSPFNQTEQVRIWLQASINIFQQKTDFKQMFFFHRKWSQFGLKFDFKVFYISKRNQQQKCQTSRQLQWF